MHCRPGIQCWENPSSPLCDMAGSGGGGIPREHLNSFHGHGSGPPVSMETGAKLGACCWEPSPWRLSSSAAGCPLGPGSALFQNPFLAGSESEGSPGIHCVWSLVGRGEGGEERSERKYLCLTNTLMFEDCVCK